jgi:hypothetical protein
MGNNIWDFVWSDGFSFNFAQFELGLTIFDFSESESAFHVIQQSIVFVGFSHCKDIHNSDWELDISSGFIIDFNSCLFILNDDIGLSRSQCKS